MSWSREKLRKLRRNLQLAAVSLPDEAALETPELFPLWTAETEYAKDRRVRFDGVLYRCVQAHTSQDAWKPSDAPALWTRVADPAEEWPEWVQPLGAEDAYPAGAKVTHSGKRWINTWGDGNIWEPGVFGWEAC